jgi:hypothetical protein
MSNIAQIQIQPVDNGFVVQAVNLDGENYSRRFIAKDESELRTLIKEVADQLYVPRPKKDKPAKAEPEPTNPAA